MMNMANQLRASHVWVQWSLRGSIVSLPYKPVPMKHCADLQANSENLPWIYMDFYHQPLEEVGLAQESNSWFT